MNYWLNLFTWKTWQEFLNAGGDITGFRSNRWRSVQKIKPGDQLICYMTGISRFFGLLEVTGKPFRDEKPIWEDAIFPSRLPVKRIMSLDPEYAVPVELLKEKLSYFQNMKSPYSWTGHFRGSPTKEKWKDAEAIIDALEEAYHNPISRELDRKKLHKKVYTSETKKGLISVPDQDDEIIEDITQAEIRSTITHEQIQWQILNLGAAMGLDLWVAKNDRNKSFNGEVFGEMSNVKDSLPNQFDEGTNRIIEVIDVLWLKKNAIVAAFEIEHTTTIYSGLLRMSDLMTVQPNLDINLYIVAPDERKEQTRRQINRPTFSQALRKPLSNVCSFIGYTSLQVSLDKYQDILHLLPPRFLDEIAENLEIEDI